MVISTKSTVLIAFVLATALCACATMQAYEGPKRPQGHIALIKSNHLQGFMASTGVKEIDGKSLSSDEDRAEVLPGVHNVRIEIIEGLGTSYINFEYLTLPIDAKAGHVYQVNGEINGGVPYAWIIDMGDGQIVSGQKP